MPEPRFVEVQRAIRDGVRLGRASVDAVAARLHCSPSTLHRRLRRHGTTFTRERRAAQVGRAFELLTDGTAPGAAAAAVGLSTDYLCVCIRQSYGLTPRAIQTITRTADALRDRPGTRPELAQFERHDEKLQELVAGIDASHPLAAWAKQLVLRGNRPEYYEPEFLRGLRAEEARQRLRRREEMEAASVSELTPEEARDPIDFEYLLREREEAREAIPRRVHQLRRARRHLKAYGPTTPTTPRTS